MGEGRWTETWIDRNFIHVSMPYSVGKPHPYLGTQIEEKKKERFEKLFTVKLFKLCNNDIKSNTNYANLITNIAI